MSTAADSAAMERLLSECLAAWRIRGDVRSSPTGALIVTARDMTIDVAPADRNLPFRWLVTVDGRSRPAVSVVAVLRQVRHAIDPGFRTSRIRVAAPVVAPPAMPPSVTARAPSLRP